MLFWEDPTLNASRAVIVTHLMLMKYECNNGTVGTIHGDQQVARECYVATLRTSSGKKEEQGELKKRKIEEAPKQEVMAVMSLNQVPKPQPLWGK